MHSETDDCNDDGGSIGLTPLLAADDEPAKRLNDAAVVFSEIMATPDKGIPQDLVMSENLAETLRRTTVVIEKAAKSLAAPNAAGLTS